MKIVDDYDDDDYGEIYVILQLKMHGQVNDFWWVKLY